MILLKAVVIKSNKNNLKIKYVSFKIDIYKSLTSLKI